MKQMKQYLNASIIAELMKISPLIDAAYDEIMERKDDGLVCGDFTVKMVNKTGVYGYAYDMINIIYTKYLNHNNEKDKNTLGGRNFLNFCRTTGHEYHSVNTVERVGLSTSSNSCTMDLVKEVDVCGYDLYLHEDVIPYDSTGTVEERKMSVEIACTDADSIPFMNSVIDFQSLGLKNVDYVQYNYSNMVDGYVEHVYNALIQHTFFKRRLK